MEECMLDLYAFNLKKDGLITCQELEYYVIQHISTLSKLSISSQFLPFYIKSLTKKFQFFLDPLKRGFISIKSLLKSTEMVELFELRSDNLSDNWFTKESSERIYHDFCSIDTKEIGVLGLEEAMAWPNWSLTHLSTKRLFQVYGKMGKLDYEGYLEVILGLLYIQSERAVKYWFRILDIDSKGYLNSQDFEKLFKVRFHLLNEYILIALLMGRV